MEFLFLFIVSVVVSIVLASIVFSLITWRVHKYATEVYKHLPELISDFTIFEEDKTIIRNTDLIYFGDSGDFKIAKKTYLFNPRKSGFVYWLMPINTYWYFKIFNWFKKNRIEIVVDHI